MTADSGSFIVSPGYPHNYNNNLRCKLNIELARNENIVLYFISLAVQSNNAGNDCPNIVSYDYLLVQPGYLNLKLCGSSTPDPIVMSQLISYNNHRLRLEFFSDSFYEFKGFKLQVAKGKPNKIPTNMILLIIFISRVNNKIYNYRVYNRWT